MLEHHAHLVPAKLDQLSLGGVTQVLTVEVDFAGGWFDEARHAADEGGFPRATQAHQYDELALVDLQRGVPNGGDVAALFDGGQVRFAVVGR